MTDRNRQNCEDGFVWEDRCTFRFDGLQLSRLASKLAFKSKSLLSEFLPASGSYLQHTTLLRRTFWSCLARLNFPWRVQNFISWELSERLNPPPRVSVLDREVTSTHVTVVSISINDNMYIQCFIISKQLCKCVQQDVSGLIIVSSITLTMVWWWAIKNTREIYWAAAMAQSGPVWDPRNRKLFVRDFIRPENANNFDEVFLPRGKRKIVRTFSSLIKGVWLFQNLFSSVY